MATGDVATVRLDVASILSRRSARVPIGSKLCEDALQIRVQRHGEPASEPVARTNSGGSGGGSKDSGSFECNICLDLAQDPGVTLCGHLFCWPCLYKWLHVDVHSQECPICKAVVEEGKLVPLYGRGGTSAAPRARSVASVQIPSRPTGQRPSTTPQPDHNNHCPHMNLWFMGAQVAGSAAASRRSTSPCRLWRG
ncbi:uncharacterized protein [Setaria viridis]|uniref:uncharacterized protein n=1 Tax=Setaria viridis TaxID=4556 RepID=UPI003B3A8096